MKKTGYRTADEIVTNMALPVLGVVPDLVPAPRQRRQRRRTVALTLFIIVVVIIGAAVARWML